MNKPTSNAETIRNLILFSPFVVEAEIEAPDLIKCRFGALDESMLISIDGDGIARLQSQGGFSNVNLALGPADDWRIVTRSLDYFLSGVEEARYAVTQHA